MVQTMIPNGELKEVHEAVGLGVANVKSGWIDIASATASGTALAE